MNIFDEMECMILCHMPQYAYGPRVPKLGYKAKPTTQIRKNTGAGDTVLAKHI